MKFLSLTVENFGVFRGLHHFNFVAQESRLSAPERNITLVRGHNGAGKSTLFGAFALALHGPLSLGDRTSRTDYNDFLLGRMHRNAEGEPSQRTHLSLSFEYVESGRSVRFDVERGWTRNGRIVTEELRVRRDGAKPDEVAPDDYPAYLSDLVPLGLSPVCFFDAEKLDALSTSSGHESQLAGIMRRLLGLDLVERLREDLDFYTFKQGGKEIEPLRAEVFARQQELAGARAKITPAQDELASLSERSAVVREAIAGQEHRLAAAGGSYAERRPHLQERRAVLGQEIEALQKELREMCEGLLPFALAPGLCRALNERLAHEADVAHNAAFGQVWQSRIDALRAQMDTGDFWRKLDISDKEQRKVTQRVVKVLGSFDAEAGAQKPLHPMSEPERDKLQGWVIQATGEVPALVASRTALLRELREEARRIDAELHRAPDNDALAPIHAEVERLNGELAELQRRDNDQTLAIARLQFECEEKERLYNRAVEEFTTAQKTWQKLALADRSKSVLRVYKDALTRGQLSRLEERVATNFNRLCQKERLLRSVSIDPDSFAVTAHDAQGRTLGLHDFSAGERQIYSLSLLWGLRQISGRELPLLIDTPLGRLDEAHRSSLLESYFPDVSKQVLLFTTTAEVDAALLAQLERRLAWHYHLQFEADEEQTRVEVVPIAALKPAQSSNGHAANGHANGHFNGYKPLKVIPLVAAQRSQGERA